MTFDRVAYMRKYHADHYVAKERAGPAPRPVTGSTVRGVPTFDGWCRRLRRTTPHYANGSCIDCLQNDQLLAAAEHPEWAERARQRYNVIRLVNGIAAAVEQAWRIEFADEIRERVNARTRVAQRQARIDDPERIRARERAKRAANPMVYKAIKHNRRARKQNAPGFCTAAQLQARRDMFGGCCWVCGAPADTDDHVKPLIAGGSNWPANFRPACFSCNSSKQGQWPFPTQSYPHARVAF